MSADSLLVEDRGPVRVLTLNRPKVRNALDQALRAAIAEAVTQADLSPDVRTIVLTGGGSCFCAGGDIAESSAKTASDAARANLQRYWQPIHQCGKPLIAAVNGYAFGGGFELASACDIIIAGESAVFALPELRIGIMPGAGGTQHLVRAAGKFKAMRYALTGDRFGAREAEAMGCVSEVVPDDKVLARALALAAQIASLPPLAVRAIKQVTIAGPDASFAAGLLMERTAHNALFDSEDKREGMSAFLEKRQPRFTGR